MTARLDTFAKVRALHDGATLPGEKAAAAARMQVLARKAGLTVEQAVSKLDATSRTAAKPPPRSPARAAADAINEFFNRPEFVAARAERERERAEKWRRVVEEYGSEDAVFAPGTWEGALEEACARFVVRGETTGWRIGSLWGWDTLTFGEPAPEIREAVATAYPLPATVQQAWAEFRFWEKLAGDREAHGTGSGDPAPWVYLRTRLVEELLNTLPARSLNDLRARLSWMEHLNGLEVSPDPAEERVRLATFRADIERMGERLREQDGTPVQSGHAKGPAPSTHPSRRTNAEKRRDVLTLLRMDAGSLGNQHLSDREIARRAGVSPQTVGNIRRGIKERRHGG